MFMLRFGLLILTLGATVIAGTVFFHYIEGWSWLDSYFFTVITLSTVGYGTLVPVTAIGKIATTVFIFLGLGIFAMTIQQFGQFTKRKREEHTEWLLAFLGQTEAEQIDEIEDTANRDEKPHQSTKESPKE